ncbi:transposase [Rodentibacter myodis]|uniref:Transposase IS4-like domain-containing protein n=1 Tax=Rodentibacter myodis TaxID=1907939 RepID=A0A1V3JPN3_9PAST|nr:transposase [Rodentibacter myodis]OOF58779.1 hypothetical protein BKL49_06445 [Rodentibacter myodis]
MVQTSSTQSHWLIPLRKEVKYDILRELGLEKIEKGKHFQCITSLLDNTTYPANEVVSVYRHRRKIELGYREVKQYLLAQAYTLKNKKPERASKRFWEIYGRIISSERQ